MKHTKRGYVVSPDLAPVQGPCAVCKRTVDRGSFCCGCGRFVCWTHGEPPTLLTRLGNPLTFAPHTVADHTCGEATRAA